MWLAVAATAAAAMAAAVAAGTCRGRCLATSAEVEADDTQEHLEGERDLDLGAGVVVLAIDASRSSIM